MGKNPLIGLSSAQRRTIATLAFIVALTSTRVQAVDAGTLLLDAPVRETGEVEQNDVRERGIFVPVSLNGSLENAKDIPAKRIAYMTITSYTSLPGETDDSPFITADGSHVSDGIVAANGLPFGTRMRIPALFGAKVFEVHDRMNPRYSNRIDIWVDTRAKARAIGIRHGVKIEILN